MYGPMLDWNHGQGGAIDGTLRQYAVYAASALIKIPEECELSFMELSTLVCAGLTVASLPQRPDHTQSTQSTRA